MFAVDSVTPAAQRLASHKVTGHSFKFITGMTRTVTVTVTVTPSLSRGTGPEVCHGDCRY